MKKKLLFVLSGFLFFHVYGQKQVTVSECTVTYAISGADANINKNLAGTVKTLYVKGNMSRVDLNGNNFTQSIIYDNKSGNAVVLKEVGNEKYISAFTADKWKKENKRFDGMKTSLTAEKKKVLGYDCKKAIATLSDGSSYTIFYATSITTSATENPYQFKDIPGFVLEYETSPAKSSSKITFTAISINFDPVPAVKFEIPISGYRALE